MQPFMALKASPNSPSSMPEAAPGLTSSGLTSQLAPLPLRLKTFVIAVLGTVLEYYDYSLYGFCASQIAKRFFVAQDPSAALLKAFAVFMVGSLAKPLVAAIFGSIGDRYGRSRALRLSMLGMAVPTGLIGLLPSYEEIGLLAPMLLLVCRLLQGLCSAGESDGVRIFIYEGAGLKRACLANSLAGLACMAGIALAAQAASLPLLLGWGDDGWRYLFLLGGGLGALVYWQRHNLQESPAFVAYLKKPPLGGHCCAQGGGSLWLTVLSNKRALLATVLFCGAVGGGYHFYLVFFPGFLSAHLHLYSLATAALLTSRGVLLYTLVSPLAGLLGDRLGPLRLLRFSAGALLGALLLNFLALTTEQAVSGVFYLTVVVLAFFQAPAFVVLLPLFQVHERYRCASIGHALGSMLFSGSTPFISLWLWQSSGYFLAPLMHFAVLSCMGIVALFLVAL